MVQQKELRIFTDLHSAASHGPSETALDIFCPMLEGLPREHAWVIAQLPIHDANQVLLDALSQAHSWPRHVTACIFDEDPFRTSTSFLQQLQREGVTKICIFPFLDVAPHSPTEDGNCQRMNGIQAIATQGQDHGLDFLDLSRDQFMSAYIV